MLRDPDSSLHLNIGEGKGLLGLHISAGGFNV
jgi:hypothetical protein